MNSDKSISYGEVNYLKDKIKLQQRHIDLLIEEKRWKEYPLDKPIKNGDYQVVVDDGTTRWTDEEEFNGHYFMMRNDEGEITHWREIGDLPKKE